jgi:c-di-GMP-related signal transduction protein
MSTVKLPEELKKHWTAFAETMAPIVDTKDPETCFVAGMYSALSALEDLSDEEAATLTRFTTLLARTHIVECGMAKAGEA